MRGREAVWPGEPDLPWYVRGSQPAVVREGGGCLRLPRLGHKQRRGDEESGLMRIGSSGAAV
jgi:hypothetical protein